jgi:predicted nuclease of predicted toxin-antitoxin system
MLKFILDVGVGNRVWQYLIHEGYDATLISAINPKLTDSDILAIAETEERMVVTMDMDFGELVYRSNKAHKGVLLLRLEDANGSEKAAIMKFIIDNFINDIEGKFCVYKNGRLRIR